MSEGLPSILAGSSALAVGMGMYSSQLPRHVKETPFEYKFEVKKDFAPLKKRKQKLIRIFISSTFEDMTLERDHLTSLIYPRIEAYCHSKGWNFLTVDLRWGIRDESTDDHKTTVICQEEIQRCQEISPGVNFVLLLGNRAGWRPLPPFIPLSEYHVLRSHCLHPDLLEKWYVPDLNYKPEPRYCLTPLTMVNRNDFWREVCPVLIPDLHQAVKKYRDSGKLPYERFANYFASVTENEVVSGILNSASDHKPIVMLRNIKNYDANAPNAHKFANLVTRPSGERAVDEEAWSLVTDLKHKLKQVIPAERLFEYEADWIGDGISNGHVEQQGQDLEKALVAIIEAEMARFQEPEEGLQEDESHMDYAHRLSQFFSGRVSECKTLAAAFPSPGSDESFQAAEWRSEDKPKFEDGSTDFMQYSERFPVRVLLKAGVAGVAHAAGRLFVVTGAEGMGKKSLLAHLACKMQPEGHGGAKAGRCVVFRACDLTEKSSYGTRLLLDMYLHLYRWLRGEEEYTKEAHRVYHGEKFLDQRKETSHWQVITALHELLLRIPPSKPTTLILAGVRDVMFEHAPFVLQYLEYAWIPNPLPPHLNIILAGAGAGVPTTLQNFLDGKHVPKLLEERCRAQLPSSLPEAEREEAVQKELREFVPSKFETVYIRLGAMSAMEVESQLDRALLAQGRALAAPQRRYAVDHIMKTNSAVPGVVEMVANHVANWRSTNPATLQENLPTTLEQGVAMFLQKAEKYHGALLVGRTLSYLVLARDGISEVELRSALTIDAEVVKDVSQYHSAKELPAIVWSRLFLDVEPFLNEQNGKLRPRQPALVRVVRARYLADVVLERTLHRRLALTYLTTAQPSRQILSWTLAQIIGEKNNVPAPTPAPASAPAPASSAAESDSSSSGGDASGNADTNANANTNADTGGSGNDGGTLPSDQKADEVVVSAAAGKKDGGGAHSWKDDDDWQAPIPILRNIVHHLRLGQLWPQVDTILTDLVFIDRVRGPSSMAGLLTNTLAECIIHHGPQSYVEKLPKVYQICLFMTTSAELGHFGVKTWQPWEPIPENTPPNDLQQLINFRIRGSPVCHWENGTWLCFDRRFFGHLTSAMHQPFLWRNVPQPHMGSTAFQRRDKFQLESINKAGAKLPVKAPLMRHDQFTGPPMPQSLKFFSFSPNWGVNNLRMAQVYADKHSRTK